MKTVSGNEDGPSVSNETARQTSEPIGLQVVAEPDPVFSWTCHVPFLRPWTLGDLDGESNNHRRCIRPTSPRALGIHSYFECRVTAEFQA